MGKLKQTVQEVLPDFTAGVASRILCEEIDEIFADLNPEQATLVVKDVGSYLKNHKIFGEAPAKPPKSEKGKGKGKAKQGTAYVPKAFSIPQRLWDMLPRQLQAFHETQPNYSKVRKGPKGFMHFVPDATDAARDEVARAILDGAVTLKNADAVRLWGEWIEKMEPFTSVRKPDPMPKVTKRNAPKAGVSVPDTAPSVSAGAATPLPAAIS